MFTFKLIDPWAAWVAALAAPLHGRLAWRLPTIVLGILLANGRRTITRWWIAAGISKRFRSYYYSLDSIGRKAQPLAGRGKCGRGKWDILVFPYLSNSDYLFV